MSLELSKELYRTECGITCNHLFILFFSSDFGLQNMLTIIMSLKKMCLFELLFVSPI